MTGTCLTDDELVAHFSSATLPAAAFSHDQHVRAAWLFVTRHGMPAALTTFPAALRRFAATHGAAAKYHETITWAFLLLVHERHARQPASSWNAFASANRDLLTWRPSILESFYTADTLASELARQVFVMPDRTGS
jgi:hypothetical protein